MRRSLFWTAGLPLIGLVVFMASLAVMLPSDGKFGPEVLLGWPNRIMVLAFCAWLMMVAWRAIRLHGQRS